jgi:outer membrane protein insertion porin family
LSQSGLFDFVKAGARETPEGLQVIFTVYPKYRIRHIAFQGNQHFQPKRLLKEIKLASGELLDESKAKASLDKVIDLYEKAGYYGAKAHFEIQRDAQTGLSDLTFIIQEGQKRRIRQITFQGNEQVSARKLRKLIQTKRWNALSWLDGSGYIKERMLQEDVERIVNYYRDLGYLDVQVDESDIVLDDSRQGAVSIAFKINEGRRYITGNVEVAGNTLFSKAVLKEGLKLKPGEVLSAGVLERDITYLQNRYGSGGYLDTYVVADRKPNPEQPDQVDVKYTVHEGERFYVDNITIQGNTITRSNVILRETLLAPGDLFDSVRMRISEARLQNTRFFSDVSLAAEPSDLPNRRNLRIKVKEGKTANIAFGGGFSTLDKAMLYTEFSQGNFDVFNRKTYFRGDGQKLRLRLSFAQKSNELLFAFEEPWVCQRELAAGFQVYRNENRYDSSLYKERRLGAMVYTRKAFFDLFEGQLSYSVDQVDLFDMNAAAPAYLQEEKGKRTICKLTLSFLYDTRNDLVFPSQGSRLEWINELAGGPAGGSTKFARCELRAGRWFPTFETLDQVWAIYGRTGVVGEYGGSRVPHFERYFLGGPDNLRGYDHREAGPLFPDGEPRGGKTFAFVSTEYIFRLLDPVRLVFFYDIGFTNLRTADYRIKNVKHNCGVGLRVFVMGAPLRFDVAFPYAAKDNGRKKSPTFHFSCGVNF